MKRSFLVDGDAVNIILAINHHITDEESCRSWNTSVGQIVVCRKNAILGVQPNGVSS